MSQLIIQYTAIAASPLLLQYVNITVSCSSSLSHQCQTRQTPLHLRKMGAETRASAIFDLNGQACPCWKRVLSVNWTLAHWELRLGALDDIICPVVAGAHQNEKNEEQSNAGSYSQSIDMYVMIYDGTRLCAVELDWATHCCGVHNHKHICKAP